MNISENTISLFYGVNLTEFKEMDLKPELIESLKRLGFVAATEVQERTIPELLQGKSLIARAKTGTGKTAAFIVPIMQSIGNLRDIEALIIVPTRIARLDRNKLMQLKQAESDLEEVTLLCLPHQRVITASVHNWRALPVRNPLLASVVMYVSL